MQFKKQRRKKSFYTKKKLFGAGVASVAFAIVAGTLAKPKGQR